ncbi:MAG: 5'-nucleotidase C-terminal domain-containing protein [Myxococcota bacterium]
MRSRLPLAVSMCVVLAACPEPKPPPPPPPPVKDAGPPPRTVTVLVTGHESGELPLRAPRLLAEWTEKEGWPNVIALSTGDTFAGNAISSRFDGLPTAEAMKAMQYRAASLGNHDLDLGVEVLKNFVKASGITLLAANLKRKDGKESPLPGHVIFERSGVKVGVVGLTSEKTLYTTEPGRAADYELAPAGLVLPSAISDVKKAGAEAVVIILDDCFSTIQPLFAAHPEWDVDAVVGGRCEGPQESTAGKVPFYSIGDDLSAYVAVRIELSPGGHAVKTSRQSVAPEGKEDADLAALRARWQAKLKEELGQVIGFAKKGFPADAPELRTLVATALRDEAKADAALINKKGVRAALPKGPITRETVYSMIPFENAVLTVKVKGELLLKLKTHPEAVMVLPKGKVDPAKDYLLATTEYLYFGGDDLGFEAAAPNPELTGQVWQTPVVAWIARKGSTEKKPLEPMLK